MASQLKPLKPWGVIAANPPKVIMLLEELGLPYEPVNVQYADVKQPPFLAINPNGRMPALEDPNADLTIWESGAILEYLVERYDRAHRMSFPAGSKEAALARQWLFFQVSGQGPYYGQAVWFAKYHPEKVPSAVDRYVKEINRVTSVLESHLAKQKGNVTEAGASGADGPWLVGGRISYADIAFVPWQSWVPLILSKEQYDEAAYPNVKKWLDNMHARPAVSKAMETATAALKR